MATPWLQPWLKALFTDFWITDYQSYQIIFSDGTTNWSTNCLISIPCLHPRAYPSVHWVEGRKTPWTCWKSIGWQTHTLLDKLFSLASTLPHKTGQSTLSFSTSIIYWTVTDVTAGNSSPLVLRALRVKKGYTGRVPLPVASSPPLWALRDSQLLWLILHRSHVLTECPCLDMMFAHSVTLAVMTLLVFFPVQR